MVATEMGKYVGIGREIVEAMAGPYRCKGTFRVRNVDHEYFSCYTGEQTQMELEKAAGRRMTSFSWQDIEG